MENGSRHPYEGVLTESEYAEVQSLRQEFASAILIMMFGQSKALLGEPTTRYSGSVAEDALDAQHGSGVTARLPWEAVIAHASSLDTILLLAGHMCIPIARSFFQSEDSWQAARAIILKKVGRAPKPRRLAESQGRTVVLWLALLVVIFLAWHFAQIPHAK